jgi:hypothetical protein
LWPPSTASSWRPTSTPARDRGQVAVYAVGDLALLAVLGDDELDVDHLRLKSQPALDRIHAILAGQRNGA